MGDETAKARDVPCPGTVLRRSWKPVPARSFTAAASLFINTMFGHPSRGLQPRGAVGAVCAEPKVPQRGGGFADTPPPISRLKRVGGRGGGRGEPPFGCATDGGRPALLLGRSPFRGAGCPR